VLHTDLKLDDPVLTMTIDTMMAYPILHLSVNCGHTGAVKLCRLSAGVLDIHSHPRPIHQRR
jgi:hypothetical protein